MTVADKLSLRLICWRLSGGPRRALMFAIGFSIPVLIAGCARLVR